MSLHSGVPGSEWRGVQKFRKKADKMIIFLLIVYFYSTKNYRSISLFLNSVSNI